MNSPSSPYHILALETLPADALHTILLEEKEAWENTLGWGFDNIAAVFRDMVRSRILPGVALMRQGQCRGYIYHLFRDTRCLVGMFFSREVEGTGLPQACLRHMFQTPALIPLPPRIEGQILFPWADNGPLCWLQEAGFITHERRFLRTAAPPEPPSATLRAGLHVLPLDPSQIEELATAMHASYDGHVDQEISSMYRSREGCYQLLVQLALRDGCGATDLPCCFCLSDRGLLRGLVLVSRINTGRFFIPQIFVHPSLQGEGGGTALMTAAMQAVRRRCPTGDLALTVTVANERAYRWYSRLGFRDVTTHWSFLRAPEPPRSQA